MNDPTEEGLPVGDTAPLTYDLDTLLAMITPENLPLARDLLDAAPVGKEIW